MIRRASFAVALVAVLASNVKGAELRGKVLRADGKPAVGARVWAAALHVSPAVRKETRADDKGEFCLDLQPLRRFGWWVSARMGRQGGEATDRRSYIEVVEGREPDPVTIQLEERGVLRGRVVAEETGKPVAGVRLFTDRGEILTTDDEGRYETGGIRTGRHTLIAVSPGRERPHLHFDTTLRPDAELDIRLRQAATIRGRILDEQGKPIPGAYVQRRASGDALTLDGWTEACDAQGRFALEVPFHQLVYSLSFIAPDHEYQERNMILLRAGEGPEWLIRMKRMSPNVLAAIKAEEQKPKRPEHPRRELTGQVFLHVNKPLANVVVRWGTTTEESLKRETRTDKDGTFALKDVPDREGLLIIIPPENAPQFVEAPKGQARVTVRVEVGQTTGGVVRGWDGRPLPAVLVLPELLSPDRTLSLGALLNERGVVTDDNGAFRFRGLPTAARFHFQGLGLKQIVRHQLRLGAFDNVVEMMAENGAIRGRVLDPQGKPVRNFVIQAGTPRVRGLNERLGGGHAQYTADDGVFVLGEVGEPGAVVRVVASADGFGQAVVDRFLVLPLDELLPPEVLTLRLTAPHSLRVRVVDERNGNPLPDAAVTLIDSDLALDEKFMWGYDDLNRRSIPADKDGWAAFPRLVFNEATMLVRCPGYARTRIAWRKGEKELIVRLRPEAVVTWTLTIKNPGFLGDWIHLTSATGDTYSIPLHKEGGSFRVSELPPGDYTLAVPDKGGERSESFLLRPGETRKLMLQTEGSHPSKP